MLWLTEHRWSPVESTNARAFQELDEAARAARQEGLPVDGVEIFSPGSGPSRIYPIPIQWKLALEKRRRLENKIRSLVS